MNIMLSDKIEVSALQLTVWLDEYFDRVLEYADSHGGNVDSTLIARDFVAEKFRERLEKGGSDENN